MSANASSGILDSCFVRVSVRKEVKGGSTFQKLGFADVDLAELAGCGLTTKKYLLEGYNTKKARQDNSTLKVHVDCGLLRGDPLFKRPTKCTSSFYATLPPRTEVDSHTSNSGPVTGSSSNTLLIDRIGDGANSTGSGDNASGVVKTDTLPNALPGTAQSLMDTENVQTDPEVAVKMPIAARQPSGDSVEGSHSRNSSSVSQQSKASYGYKSTVPSYSRHSSSDHSDDICDPSCGSGYSDQVKYNSVERKQRAQKKLLGCSSDVENRVDSTRINTEQLINELVESNLGECDVTNLSEQEVGLQLFVAKDGTAKLGSRTAKGKRSSRKE